jgi:hypothetical protein
MNAITDRNDGEELPTGAGASGAWVTPEVSYVDPRRRFCDLCGRPIARRYWQSYQAGQRRTYCDPAHAALDTAYPKSPLTNQE